MNGGQYVIVHRSPLLLGELALSIMPEVHNDRHEAINRATWYNDVEGHKGHEYTVARVNSAIKVTELSE